MITQSRTTLACYGLLCTLFCSCLRPADTETAWSYAKETSERHAAKMQWLNTVRFGTFVHWGVYSVTGGAHKSK
jgi:hypothetical protein